MALPPAKVDRQSTTPFFLKLFYKSGNFNRLDEFTSSELPPHLQIYTWPTCTLRELSHLITSSLPTLLPDPIIGTRLSFRLIFPDTRGSSTSTGPPRYMTKDLGSVIIGDGGPGILPDEEEAAIVEGGYVAGALGGEPEKTLQDAKFVIGDYVACAIMAPLGDGSVAPSPANPARGGGGFGAPRGEFGGRGGGGFGQRENINGFGGGGFGGGARGRGGQRGGGNFGQGFVPAGEWRRGERLPDGPSGGRGRGFGGGFGGGRGRY